MNAVEIEAAISDLAAQPFDRSEFPFAFLQAFGNKEATLKRLRSGETNRSDLGGVLQAKNIHILVAPEGQVSQSLSALKASPATAKAKARFILATDGIDFEAEDLESDDAPVSCAYADFPDHFGFFLPLAGITTVKQVRENAFDIRATSRLNRLYLELLKTNPEWGTAERRPEMNHFMARLIFCFFAEDTDIFEGTDLFSDTIERMSARDSSNTHEVIREMFRAMNVKREDRSSAKLPRWTDAFPYVNGDLFSGSVEVPRFSKIARSYLLHVGRLDWTKINPDIFGSMIQAVADDEERGALGMHYTSVPNILKVLDPLFLDDLREQLATAGDNPRMLLNLRKRISKIRVFDPACGSGNFLVIAYKQMREIENEINVRRGEKGRKSDIPLTNFRGIELRDFPAEIARLALIIAQYQCNLEYLGQQEALKVFLPLESKNWITCGNALRLDWLSICPPTGTTPTQYSGDLFVMPEPQLEFENEGGETFICGNPPYYGSRKQEESQKSDIKKLSSSLIKKWKSLDYVAGWFLCARNYMNHSQAECAFVATSSICEGLQVALLWPHILKDDLEIKFGFRPFKWTNLAAKNAGVTVVITGIARKTSKPKSLYLQDEQVWRVDQLTPYLSPGKTVYVDARPEPISRLSKMVTGSMPRDGGHLIFDASEAARIQHNCPEAVRYLKQYVGSDELINGHQRKCIWIDDNQVLEAKRIPEFAGRFEMVRQFRNSSTLDSTREFSEMPHRFVYLAGKAKSHTIAVATVSSEHRNYLPAAAYSSNAVISNLALALYDAPIWQLSIIVSSMHVCWISAVCGKLETRYRYSNTLGWNTFPVPTLTEKNKADLTRCAEDILLAREAHFPATIADLYDPKNMPRNLRDAHERNDEVLERIYIGRRFRNDTERLEKLFDLYTKMTAGSKALPVGKSTRVKRSA